MMCLSYLYAQDAAYQTGLLMTNPDVRGMAAGQVPGFAGEPNPNFNASSIGASALQHQASSDVGKYISSHQKDKQKFVINDSNPLLTVGHKAASDPHTVMEHVVIEEKSGAETEKIVICEQGGDAYIQKCEKHLEIDLEVKPATYKTEYYCERHFDCPGHGSERAGYIFCDGSCNRHGRFCYQQNCKNRSVIDQPKSVKITREEWIDGCHILESLADQGLCQCVDSEVGGQETHTISSEPITRDSWFEKHTYQCLKASKDNCEALAVKGCVQVKSRCKERIGGVCVLYEQTYRCKQGKRKGTSYRAVGDKKPFCLTGDCSDDSYEDNGELFEALSQLTVLSRAQEDLRKKLKVFGGDPKQCRKHGMGFSDCCTTGGAGWGQSLKLAGCNTEERELADWRPQKRCVLVGTYCAEKVLGKCLRKKTSFCCFGTKLLRIIQEQGRSQLGISWGEPEHPDCRGLTPEELSRLDMSQMDLSELFADVAANFKPPTQGHIAKGTELESIRTNMKNIMANLKKEGISSPEGRPS